MARASLKAMVSSAILWTLRIQGNRYTRGSTRRRSDNLFLWAQKGEVGGDVGEETRFTRVVEENRTPCREKNPKEKHKEGRGEGATVAVLCTAEMLN